MLPRLLALCVIALLLMPNPLVVQRALPFETGQRVTATPLAIPRDRIGAVRIAEAWQLDARHSRFGGISSMALVGDRRFVMASDSSLIVRFALGETAATGASSVGPLWLGARDAHRKAERDLESMARDPVSGRIWVGFEIGHGLMRYAPELARNEGEVRPRAMKGWNGNGGAEALALLPDGRLLVMAETSGGPGGGSDALLFARDPVGDAAAAATPLRFAYDAQGKGRVTDATALPDGRVLILHRTISPFEGWISTLAVADSRTIARGEAWRSRTIARLAGHALSENYEALAVETDGNGFSIWMASDDNLTRWQRTLLLRLTWDGTSVSGQPTAP